MNKRKLFEIGIKLIGVYLLYITVLRFLLFAKYLQYPQCTFLSVSENCLSPQFLVANFVVAMFTGILGALFFYKPKRISEKLIEKDDESVALKKQILTIVVAFVGLNLIIPSIITALEKIIMLMPNIVVEGTGSLSIAPSDEPMLYLISFNVILILVGIYMLFNSTKLADVLNKKIPEKFWK